MLSLNPVLLDWSICAAPHNLPLEASAVIIIRLCYGSPRYYLSRPEHVSQACFDRPVCKEGCKKAPHPTCSFVWHVYGVCSCIHIRMFMPKRVCACLSVWVPVYLCRGRKTALNVSSPSTLLRPSFSFAAVYIAGFQGIFPPFLPLVLGELWLQIHKLPWLYTDWHKPHSGPRTWKCGNVHYIEPLPSLLF